MQNAISNMLMPPRAPYSPEQQSEVARLLHSYPGLSQLIPLGPKGEGTYSQVLKVEGPSTSNIVLKLRHGFADPKRDAFARQLAVRENGALSRLDEMQDKDIPGVRLPRINIAENYVGSRELNPVMRLNGKNVFSFIVMTDTGEYQTRHSHAALAGGPGFARLLSNYGALIHAFGYAGRNINLRNINLPDVQPDPEDDHAYYFARNAVTRSRDDHERSMAQRLRHDFYERHGNTPQQEQIVQHGDLNWGNIFIDPSELKISGLTDFSTMSRSPAGTAFAAITLTDGALPFAMAGYRDASGKTLDETMVFLAASARNMSVYLTLAQNPDKNDHDRKLQEDYRLAAVTTLESLGKLKQSGDYLDYALRLRNEKPPKNLVEDLVERRAGKPPERSWLMPKAG